MITDRDQAGRWETPGVLSDGRAAIAGAGIGGLTTAIALRDAGWEVTVFERADAFRPLGAGMALWPNGVHALRALGVADEVIGERPSLGGGELRRANGTLLAATSGETFVERYGAPLVLVHRAGLQTALLDRVGRGHVRFGEAVTAVDPDGEVTLASGQRLTADLVVGADGIWSPVRASLHSGDAHGPRASGIVAIRAVVDWPDPVPAGEWWGPGTAFGLAPLAGGQLYWYSAYEARPDEEHQERVG